jgi:hypothetical protein
MKPCYGVFSDMNRQIKHEIDFDIRGTESIKVTVDGWDIKRFMGWYVS